MPATVQLNVRMNRELRDAGNISLERKGISPSAFVRSIWEVLAQGGEPLEALLDVVRGTGEAPAGIGADPEDVHPHPVEEGQLLYAEFLNVVGLEAGAARADVLDAPYDQLMEEALMERWQERALDHG